MRKTPIRHKVRSHTRNGRRVNSYMRGRGRLVRRRVSPTTEMFAKYGYPEPPKYKAFYDKWAVYDFTRRQVSEQAAAELDPIISYIEGPLNAEAWIDFKTVGDWLRVYLVVRAPPDVMDKIKKKYKDFKFKPVRKGNPNKRKLPRRWRVSPERQREMLTIRERAKIEKELGRRG